MVSLGAARAWAQASDARALGAAEVLYDEATAAIGRKEWAVACPKLEEVVRLVPEGVGAKLTLAECYEGAGRLASAWSLYVAVEALADKQRQEERRVLAGKRATALKPLLAQITIVVPPATQALAGVEVRRDGVLVGAPQWGVPVPADRGDHEITVTATGRLPWKKTVTIPADKETARVEVGPLALAPVPEAAPNGPAPAAPLPPLPPAPFWTGPRIAGVSVGGAGVVVLAAGAVFGAQAIAKKSAAGCTGNVCPSVPSISLFKDAKSAGNVSTGLLVAGGVLLAGGVVVFVTAPRAPAEPATAVRVAPAGVALEGTW
jgi:hypothetical protein